ncbi:hypothetical protein JG687_00012356 [Phytophthora cactorum]|uniref:Uncharacterized protein n=1 Tax=Phytophthora cactorum TaxID=29920 RepID=A0A8T1U7E2_9STRA|nr:hypothetical protein PC123_g13773 [Phytophthora cactorum]KAG6953513.1 hypothetical protein JG687_00012356 [Phytophthora cactorum]
MSEDTKEHAGEIHLAMINTQLVKEHAQFIKERARSKHEISKLQNQLTKAHEETIRLSMTNEKIAADCERFQAYTIELEAGLQATRDSQKIFESRISQIQRDKLQFEYQLKLADAERRVKLLEVEARLYVKVLDSKSAQDCVSIIVQN